MTNKSYPFFDGQYQYSGQLYKELDKICWFDCYYKRHVCERFMDCNTTISFTNCRGKVKLKVILVDGILTADTKKLFDHCLHDNNCPFYKTNESLYENRGIKKERSGDVDMDNQLMVVYEKPSSTSSFATAMSCTPTQRSIGSNQPTSQSKSSSKRKLSANEDDRNNPKRMANDSNRSIQNQKSSSKEADSNGKNLENSDPLHEDVSDEEDYSDFIESDNENKMEEDEENHEESDDLAIDWISRYLCKSTTLTNDDANNFLSSPIFNQFKILFKAKKVLARKDNLLSILICNLVNTADDIYLHANPGKYNMSEESVKKECLNVSILLAITSNGIKFKPAFVLNHSPVNHSLISDNVEHVQNITDWVDKIFESELKSNKIDQSICLTENDDFYENNEVKERFDRCDCDFAVLPDSIAQEISPFQHLILPFLNGHLHQLYLENKTFPTTLQLTIECLSNAWNRLNADEIKQAFHPFLNVCSK